MTTLKHARSFTLLAAFIAFGALSAQAGTPEVPGPAADRSSLLAASGNYELADGRMLRVKVGLHRVAVAVDGQPNERWHAQSTDLLASSDGHHRVLLLRNSTGAVDRVVYEMDRLR